MPEVLITDVSVKHEADNIAIDTLINLSLNEQNEPIDISYATITLNKIEEANNATAVDINIKLDNEEHRINVQPIEYLAYDSWYELNVSGMRFDTGEAIHIRFHTIEAVELGAPLITTLDNNLLVDSEILIPLSRALSPLELAQLQIQLQQRLDDQTAVIIKV